MNQQANTKIARPRYLGLLILIMVPLPGMGVDLYTPSLPWLVTDLHTSMHLVKLTISLYLAGYGIGPLLFGSLSDVYGRKKILLFGLITYIASIAIILILQNINVLLLMRFIQGFTVAAIGSVYRAMITDSYQKGHEMHRISSVMVSVWAIGPVIAPFIGGYLQHFFGWQANFIFFIVYASIILALFPLIPETNRNKATLNISQIAGHYKTIFSNKIFWAGVICMGVVYSLITIFNVISPFFIQKVLHFNAVEFGHVALVMGCAFLFGGVTNSIIVKKFCKLSLVVPCLLIMMLLSIGIIVLGNYYLPNLYHFTMPIFLVLFFSAAVFPAGAAKCLSLFPKIAGTAGAAMGFLFTIMASLSTIIASFIASNTQVPLGIAYLVLIVSCLCAYTVLNKNNSE